MKEFRRLAVLAVLVAAMVVSWASFSFAAPAGAPAYLRVAQLSPDTPAMDVYVVASVADPAGSFTVPGVGYGTISDYQMVPAGTYTISIRSAGAPVDSPAMVATTLTTQPGSAYTLAGVGHYAGLGLTVLDDDLAMPAPGDARVRVINAAASAPRVDVAVAGGPALATSLGFTKTTGYRSVPAGRWQLLVRTSRGADAQLPAQVDAGAVYTVLLVDRGGQLAAELHADSIGSPSVPRGSVETGYGGMAGSPATTGLSVAVLALLAVLAPLAVRLRPRSQGRHGRQ